VPLGQPDAKSKDKAAPDVTAANADFTMTGEALAKEFIADQKAAGTKYQDKVVELDGVVDDANEIILGNGMFMLVGAKKPDDITGYLVRPRQEPRTRAGQGTEGQGQRPGESVQRSAGGPGQVTELEPPKTPQVTAEQVTEEYARDPAAAKEKYYDKEIIVTGTVADLEDRLFPQGKNALLASLAEERGHQCK
jgi:hypothetical protein